MMLLHSSTAPQQILPAALTHIESSIQISPAAPTEKISNFFWLSCIQVLSSSRNKMSWQRNFCKIYSLRVRTVHSNYGKLSTSILPRTLPVSIAGEMFCFRRLQNFVSNFVQIFHSILIVNFNNISPPHTVISPQWRVWENILFHNQHCFNFQQFFLFQFFKS